MDDVAEVDDVAGGKKVARKACIVWINKDWRVRYGRKAWILEQRRIIAEGLKNAGEETWDTTAHAVNLRSALLSALDKGTFETIVRKDIQQFTNLIGHVGLIFDDHLELFKTMTVRLGKSLEADWIAMMEGKTLSQCTAEEITALQTAWKDDAEILQLLREWETIQTLLVRPIEA